MEQTNKSSRGNLKERNHSILRGADSNDWEEVKSALLEDPDCINEQDERMGITAMHIAAADGNMTLVKFLLQQPGCRSSMADHSGRMPSHLAEAIGREDIVAVLRRASADRIRAAWINELDVLNELPSKENSEATLSDSGTPQVIRFPSRRPSGP